MSILNTKKPAEIQAILDQGVKGDFWQVIVATIEESIEHLRSATDSDDFKDLTPERYKLENELVKAKIKYLRMLINTPNNIVSWLESPDSRTPNFDPYADPNTDT